jgi:hypothetical protein
MAGPYDNRGEKVNEVNTYDVFGSHTHAPIASSLWRIKDAKLLMSL